MQAPLQRLWFRDMEVLVAQPERFLGDDDSVGRYSPPPSPPEHRARAGTDSASQVSVKMPRCWITRLDDVAGEQHAPGGDRTEAVEEHVQAPSAGPRNRVAGTPIRVSRAMTEISVISAISKPPPSA